MFSPGNFAPGNTTSEEKSAQIDAEISRFIDEAHQRVRSILSERRRSLDELVRLLSKQESVQGDELRRMLAESGPEGVTGSRVEKLKIQSVESAGA